MYRECGNGIAGEGYAAVFPLVVFDVAVDVAGLVFTVFEGACVKSTLVHAEGHGVDVVSGASAVFPWGRVRAIVEAEEKITVVGLAAYDAVVIHDA